MNTTKEEKGCYRKKFVRLSAPKGFKGYCSFIYQGIFITAEV